MCSRQYQTNPSRLCNVLSIQSALSRGFSSLLFCVKVGPVNKTGFDSPTALTAESTVNATKTTTTTTVATTTTIKNHNNNNISDNNNNNNSKNSYRNSLTHTAVIPF
ncbi:hypothetical protein ElyMa_007037200 [Elysia marginata]|uniref:Uncharacterized protein n=1 Tax=Elysia marginata TaxID=1093978 RepID=A0AAV4JWH4_9GAST|nr:hypothetical protein ElyMa_007037200 [Elysia marginata]